MEFGEDLIGGLLILAAVAYLVISGTLSGAQYFMTVDQIRTNPAYVGQTVRLNATLTIAGVGEQVTVTGTVPLVDVFKTDSSTNIVPEQIETLPGG